MNIIARLHDLVLVRSRLSDASRDRLHEDVVVASEEEWDRVPIPLQGGEDAVARRDKDTVGPARELVADVDHECLGDGRCVDPSARRLDLESAGTGVLAEDGEAFVVLMLASLSSVLLCLSLCSSSILPSALVYAALLSSPRRRTLYSPPGVRLFGPHS